MVMLQTSPKMFICIGFLWILTKVWENKVPRKNWTSSANSAICERHFLPSDYVTKRDDKQSRRVKKKGTDLIYRKLKPDAVPSVWPGLPPLTKPPPIPRSTTLACSAARQENIEVIQICKVLVEKGKDSVSLLKSYTIKLLVSIYQPML